MTKKKWKKTCVDLAECLQRHSVEEDRLRKDYKVLTNENGTLHEEIVTLQNQNKFYKNEVDRLEEKFREVWNDKTATEIRNEEVYRENTQLRKELKRNPLSHSNWQRLTQVFMQRTNIVLDIDSDIFTLDDGKIVAFLARMMEQTNEKEENEKDNRDTTKSS